MKPTNKTIQFGEHVKDYSIPVLNEREIRAASGILFLFLFIALMQAIFSESLVLVKYVVTIFLTDFIIRIFINPKFSPMLIIGRLIVSNQNPEYVGATQKKFAWKIGLTLAALMFVHIVLINAFSIISGLSCLVCLIFLFFESTFGICIGCKIYGWFYKNKAQYCPGEICDVKAKQDIQKTSRNQLLIVFGLIAYIVLMVFLFNNNFNETPRELWDVFK